jgi:hypothetical protein
MAPNKPGEGPAQDQARMAAQDAKNAGAALKDEAQRVASEVASQGAKVAEDVKAVGQELGSAAADKAEALAEQGKQAGVERGIGLADATRRVADDLEGSSPEIARHVRTAADSIENVANSLRERSVGDLMQDATTFARQQPGAFFGAAVLAGFAIARFAKSSASGVPAQSYAGSGYAGQGQSQNQGYSGQGYPGGTHSGGGYPGQRHGGGTTPGGAMGSGGTGTPTPGGAMGSGGTGTTTPGSAMGAGGTSGATGSTTSTPVAPATTDRAPGWVPVTEAGTSETLKPATMPAATLGGAAAHKPGDAKPGSMPTIGKETP